MDAIVAAASAVLGTPLDQPEPLLGGGRTTVLRCRTDDGDTVVVKAYRDAPDGLGAFSAEAAGLALGVAGPRLLAVDTRFPLIVMEDLGAAPSLADVLLGADAEDARAAMVTWAGGLGRLAVTSVGREDELAALRQRYDRGFAPWNSAWHAERCALLPGLLGDLSIKPPAGLEEDLAEVLQVADSTRFAVFSPGDICPDNNLLTSDGLRVLDFEGAGYHCVFLDAAYTVMPFSTCWCVFQLPPEVAKETEQAFRAEVVHAHPTLADDSIWASGLRRATSAWTIGVTTLLLITVATADRPAHPSQRPVATLRQVLRYRWRHLADELDNADDLPALNAVMRGLLTATDSWGVEALPHYPAWR